MRLHHLDHACFLEDVFESFLRLDIFLRTRPQVVNEDRSVRTAEHAAGETIEGRMF